MRARLKKRHGLSPKHGAQYPRGARVFRGSVGPPVPAAVAGQRRALARDLAAGVEHPTRPHPRGLFYANGVAHPIASPYWRARGWLAPPAEPSRRYVRVARRVWRWVPASRDWCPCPWCRRSCFRKGDPREMAALGLEPASGALAVLAAEAPSLGAGRLAGCLLARPRALYVAALLARFVEAAAPHLEGGRLDAARATVRYAARRLADPRCAELRALLRSGQGDEAVAWVRRAATRHPGAGRRVLPGVDVAR